MTQSVHPMCDQSRSSWCDVVSHHQNDTLSLSVSQCIGLHRSMKMIYLASVSHDIPDIEPSSSLQHFVSILHF